MSPSILDTVLFLAVLLVSKQQQISLPRNPPSVEVEVDDWMVFPCKKATVLFYP